MYLPWPLSAVGIARQAETLADMVVDGLGGQLLAPVELVVGFRSNATELLLGSTVKILTPCAVPRITVIIEFAV